MVTVAVNTSMIELFALVTSMVAPPEFGAIVTGSDAAPPRATSSVAGVVTRLSVTV
jgi:hypothetical protein